MSFLQVRLARDSLETPWGFRMQGGKDLNQSLTVQRVSKYRCMKTYLATIYRQWLLMSVLYMSA